MQKTSPWQSRVFGAFTAMSVMGMVLGAVVLDDRMTVRRVTGIATVLTGLVLVSGVEASSLTLRASVGDVMFVTAGTLWAGFFPALAPGLAALMAWPLLGHVPVPLEILGLLLVMTGLIVAVTTSVASARKA